MINHNATHHKFSITNTHRSITTAQSITTNKEKQYPGSISYTYFKFKSTLSNTNQKKKKIQDDDKMYLPSTSSVALSMWHFNLK